MGTTGYVKARSIGIYIDDTIVAYGTSGSFEGNTNMINVTNKGSGGNRGILPGERSYVANFSGKMRFDAGYGLEDVIIAHEAHTKIRIKMATSDSSDMCLEIDGYFSNFNWTADYGDTAIFSFTVEGTGAQGYESESQAIFDEMTTEPDSLHKDYINTLVKGLKDDGLWTKADKILCKAVHTNAAGEALINWKNPGTKNATNSGMTFTQYEGFHGNGSTQFIDSDFTPSVDGSQYQQNSACVAIYIRTNVSEDKYDFACFDGSIVEQANARNTSDATLWAINSAGQDTTGSQTDSKGFWHYNRSAAAVLQLYRNGSEIDTSIITSTGLGTLSIYIGARHNSGATTGHSTRQYSFAYFGASLNATEANNLRTRIHNYMTSLGKAI